MNMGRMIATLILLLVCICQINADLLQMNLNNYAQIKNDNYPIVVYYYGSDRQSKKFLTEFTEMANQKDSKLANDLSYGLVDVEVENQLFKNTQISNVPTIYLFLNAQNKIKYDGALNGISFQSWLKKAFRDNPLLNQYHPSSQILQFDQLQKRFSSFNLIAILITPEYRLGPLKQFVQAAKQIPEGYIYCHVHDQKMAQIFGVKNDDSKLIVYSKLEDLDDPSEEDRKKWITFTHIYDGDLGSSEGIFNFLNLFTWRGFFYVDDTKFQKLQRRQDMLPTIMLLYNKTNDNHQEMVLRVKEDRYKLYKKSALGLLDVNNLDVRKRIEKLYQIDPTVDLPRLIAIKPKNDGQFFRYIDSTLDPVEFYEKIIGNKIQPFYKDQGILSNDMLYDKAGIIKLTRSTYKSTIEQYNKDGFDVVVTYTAVICQPCQLFKPDYQSAKKKIALQSNNQIVFAKVDVELNDIDWIQIEQYPHVKLYKAKTQQVATFYDDQKYEKTLINWIKKESTWAHLLQNLDL